MFGLVSKDFMHSRFGEAVAKKMKIKLGAVCSAFGRTIGT